MKKLSFIFFLALVVVFSLFATTDYRITDYDVKVTVGNDAVYHIVETLNVNFERPHHGIVREIPIENGKIMANVSNLTCSEKYAINYDNGYLVVKIGDADKTVSGKVEYSISYDYDFGWDFNEGFDEIYFNLIGTGWECPIDFVRFSVSIPYELNPAFENFNDFYYYIGDNTYLTSGRYGSTTFNGEAYLNESTDPLGYVMVDGNVSNLKAYQGVTIKVDLPDGWFNPSAVFTVDDGAVITRKYQMGLYSNLTKEKADLRWACRIKGDGSVVFVLKEGGEDVRLSTLKTSSDTYDVSISFDGGTKRTYTGNILKNDNTYNAISMDLGTDFSNLVENKTATVTISGNNATYYLGTLNIDELKEIFQQKIEGSCSGFIFYDKGYYSDGWRYLEAAPADLRVINGVPTVDVNTAGYSRADTSYAFGYYRISAYSDNLYVNGSTKYNSADCTGTAVGTGKKNTELLVEDMGHETYSSSSGDSVTWYYAAKLCSDLEYTVDGKTYDDWFLPSKDELNLMYTELKKKGLGGFADEFYWSSSEYYRYAHYAWIQNFYDGGQIYFSRYDYNSIRAIRAF